MFASKTKIARPGPQHPDVEDNKAHNQRDRMKSSRDAVQKAMSDARIKLKPVWDLLNDSQASFDSLSELLAKCNFTMDDYNSYIEALSTSVILLKRDPKESWVNGY